MVDPVELSVFLTATLVIMLTPGPDMLYVLARTFGQGKRAGLLSVAGIAGGILVHTLLAAFGLSRLIAALPNALLVLRFAGAAYLLFLAWRTWRALPGTVEKARSLPHVRDGQLLREAFLTNLFNPKALVFFLAYFPLFATSGPEAFVQLLALGLLVVLCSIVVNGTLAVLLATAGRAFAESPNVRRSQRWITAGVLAALAVRILAF